MTVKELELSKPSEARNPRRGETLHTRKWFPVSSVGSRAWCELELIFLLSPGTIFRGSLGKLSDAMPTLLDNHNGAPCQSIGTFGDHVGKALDHKRRSSVS